MAFLPKPPGNLCHSPGGFGKANRTFEKQFNAKGNLQKVEAYFLELK
jgi:hypothetical protein